MSQSRKKFKSKTKTATNSNSVANDPFNDSEVMIKKLDGLRSTAKAEQKKIVVDNTQRNKRIAAVFIVVIGMSGIIVLSQGNILTSPIPPDTGGTTINLAGGFKKDTGASLYLIGNKVSFIYIGGQFCPYCAVERWAIVMALQTFGTFSTFQYITSGEGNIATYDFSSASYTSPYVEFQGKEVSDNTYPNPKHFEDLSAKQSDLYNRYGNGIPFIIIAGATYKNGAGPDPSAFNGLSSNQIQSQLASKQGVIYSQVSAEASYLVSYINSYLGPLTSTTTTATTTNTSG